MKIQIRAEQSSDIEEIEKITQVAFQQIEYSSHTEHLIVNALRSRQQLSLSLVALDGGQIVGHVAVSPVRLSSNDVNWYGLGPISVLPQYQGKGIGQQLVHEVLRQLKNSGANGCVLLGDPHYYQKFGFRADSRLVLANVPAEYFQMMSFKTTVPQAEVFYDDAFYLTE